MSFPANVIPVFGSQRAYADLNFAGGSFGLDGRIVNDTALLPGFTFTGASLRTMFDSTGAMTYGPNNLCLQSQTFGTTWSATAASVSSDATTAPDGTLTADKLVESATSAQHYISQSLGGLPNGRVLSVYAKYAGRQYLSLYASGGGACTAWYDLQAGTTSNVTAGATATITDVGNGWYRCSLTKPNWVSSSDTWEIHTAAVAGSFSYTGDGTSGIYLWGAQCEAVTYQTTPSTYYPTTSAAYYGARLVYDPVTLASQGILVEEARTNLCLQSQTFGTTWAATNASVSSNSVTSPDGTANADTLVEAVGAGQHYLVQTIAGLTNPSPRTLSVYAKYAGRKYLALYQSAGAAAWFDLQAGTVSNVTGSAVITDAGSGWYRCSITVASGTVTSDTYEIHTASTAGSYSYTGDGTGGIYIWQAQLEQAVGASSAIVTTSAAVTRAADDVVLTGLTLAYPVSLAAGYIKNFGTATGRAATLYIDGNNFTGLGQNSTPAPKLEVAQGGSFQAQITGSTTANGTAVNAAARAATDNVGFAVGGVLIGTDATATMPSAPTSINIGMFSDGGSEPLNGTISRIRIYNRALSDAQLQALTA